MWTVLASTIRVATGRLRAIFPGAGAGQPWRIQLSGGSDSDAADCADGWCWQSHHVPPGQSS